MKKLRLKLIAITVVTITTATLPSLNASAAWIQNGSNWNYLSDSGERKTGWINDKDTWYYLDNSGTMKTGWVNDDGTWYYMQLSGAMKTGWVNEDGTWYYMQLSGAMQTGWVNDNGIWYYMQPSGAMRTGWINDNGVKYFAAASGAMQTGVAKIEDKIYYFDVTTGALQVGDVTINGKKYTFAQTGEAIGTDIPPVSKAFDSNGAEITNTNGSNNNGSDVSTTSQSNNPSNSNHHSSGSSNNGSSGNNGGNSNNSGGVDINAGVSTSHLEDYREQYHYSVPSGWGNDPNGMVYFNGEWHLFYQYYPDGVSWGPMHWAQAVSTDLIHWKDLGIAIAPGDVNAGDGQKYIFSGSAVVDKDNTSGFFGGIEGGGLVAVYTEDNNVAGTQQQSIAYSKDNGRTWTKYNNGDPVLTNAMDPLKSSDFRDPKIFWSEDANEWMMVVAGGPLRFFSSKDLKTWKSEGNQPTITTECPDLYKLQVGDTGTYKWVLSEGGRYYRVGDFKQVDGVWNFIPDSDEHLAMNFAPDAYAAQTYYGTGENGTPDGRRIMIQWMNNWNYAGSIGKITQKFNGQYTLQNEMKLVKTDDGIRLTQQPIKEYENLRQAPTTFNNVTISPNQPNIMSNLLGSQYEIVSEFTPDANTTEVGFKLRVGKDAGQETVVKYNTETGEVTIDRSESGKAPSSSFKDPAVGKVTKTADGKIQLHIFVDSSSVEVYANDGQVTGTEQIFPNRTSQGIEVYSVGGNAKATINYYPLKGIWNNDVKGTNSVALSLSESNFTKELGEQFSIYTTTIPTTAAQGVTWSISDPSVVKIISQDDTKTTFEVTGTGNANLIATSKDGKLQKTTTLSVVDRSLPSTFSGLSNVEVSGSDWYKDDDAYVANGSGDGFAMLDEKNYDSTATYTFETDVEVVNGTAGLVLGSEVKNSPSEGSVVANLTREGAWRLFKFPGGANLPDNEHGSGNITPDANGKYHMKAVLKGNHIQYYINDKLMDEADYSFSAPGNFGFNIYNGNVKFTNAKLTVAGSDTSTLGIVKTNYEQNMGDEFTVYANQDVKYKIGNQDVVQIMDGTDSKKTTFKVVGAGETTITVTPASGNASPVTINVAGYDTNPDATNGLIKGLKNFTTSGDGKWYVKTDTNTGDASYAVKSTGDTFAMSSTKISAADDANYTLETEATVLNPKDNCASSLVLFSKSKDNPKGGSLVFNVQTNNGHWKVFEFGGSLIREGDITSTEDGKYDLKVDVVGQTVKYSINGQEVLSTSDFTCRSGYVGLGSWNADAEFRNTVFKSIDTSVGSDVVVTTGAAVQVTAPVTGETPVSTIDETDQYAATIEWSENPAIFEANKVYTCIKGTSKKYCN